MKQNTIPQATRTVVALIAAGAFLVPAVLQAQPSAHYPPGIEGIKGASLPPPGIYLRDYNYFYYSDRVNDFNGDKISAADPEALVYANVPRLVWITDLEILGGNVGFDALLPLQYTDLSLNTPFGRYSDSKFGIGDVFAEVNWCAHLSKFDFSLGYGAWMPTGESDEPVDAGRGYWTHMFTAGATWYPDANKKWALSALNRYEISQDDDPGYAGQAYTLEGGLSRALSPTVDVGVIGYYQQQVTRDSGGSSSELDKVAAAGPEISVFYPKYTLGWSLRYAYEFMAEGRLQGHTATLTITKRF